MSKDTSLWLVVAVSILGTIVVMGSSLWLMYHRSVQEQLTASRTERTPTPPPEPVIAAAPEPTPTPAKRRSRRLTDPSSAEEYAEAFQHAIDNQNFAATEELLADEVNVTIVGEGCCDSLSANDATKELEYLEESGNFDWDQGHPDVVELLESPEQYLGDTIGLAATGEVLGFGQDTDGQIDHITISSSLNLVLP